LFGWTQAPLHAPLQHSEGSAQGSVSALQLPSGPQVPAELHCPVQHSPGVVQGTPSLLQSCCAAHTPLGQELEQHSPAATHDAPFDLQTGSDFEAGLQPDDASAASAKASPEARVRNRVSMPGCSAMIAPSCKWTSAFAGALIAHIGSPNVDDPTSA